LIGSLAGTRPQVNEEKDRPSIAQNSPKAVNTDNSNDTEIANDLNGYIDRVRGFDVTPVQLANRLNLIDMQSSQTVLVGGWLTTGDPHFGVAMDELYGVVFYTQTTYRVQVQIVERSDVAADFRNPRLEKSGFQLEVKRSLLPAGDSWMDLIGRTKRDGKLHRIRHAIYFFTSN
jgi:hypothetical protein